MRFMVLVKASKNSEAGVMPSQQLLTEMGKFNEELTKAGVMESAKKVGGSDLSSLERWLKHPPSNAGFCERFCAK